MFRLRPDIFQKQTIVPVILRFWNALPVISAVSFASQQVTETICTMLLTAVLGYLEGGEGGKLDLELRTDHIVRTPGFKERHLLYET